MSVEIIHVHTISGGLTISDEGVKWLNGEAPDEWSNEEDHPVDGPPTVTRQLDVNHVHMDWAGEGSRDSLVDGGLAKFLSFTKGVAEFVFTCENGTMFGLNVSDGVMSWREVDVQLGRVCAAPANRWAGEDGDG